MRFVINAILTKHVTKRSYFVKKRFIRNSTLHSDENKFKYDHLPKEDVNKLECDEVYKKDENKLECDQVYKKDENKFEYDHLCKEDENKIEFDQPKKGKITVMVKKIHNDKKSSTVIEWKSAANAIRRLNFENRHMFGPLLLSKTKSKTHKILEPFEVIQHETRIPIIEPPIDDINISTKDINKTVTIKFDRILSFPLTNKVVHSHEIITELNHLRKHLECLCQNSFPSVTQILQKTMSIKSIETLNNWKRNMISELGEEGFEMYQAALLANGSSLHKSISCYLSSAPDSELSIKEENVGHWNSLKHIFPSVKDVKLLEEFVTHPFLCYRGVIDCFAKYKNHLVVIDWKTSKKPKSLIKHTYDDPLQIAAYVGALNFDPKFQYLANKGLIVIAYENGSPATTHYINQIQMKFYWNLWLQRVKEFWEMKNREINNL